MKTNIKYNILFIIILTLIFSGLYVMSIPQPIHAKPVTSKRVINNKHSNKKLIKNVKNKAKRTHHTNWFRDGLSNKQLKARHKIAYMESRYQWKASNGLCFGRFQLKPSYLGYKHGRLNLNHKHQVKVADAYVQKRYGSWTKALQFHLVHSWY